MDVVVYLCGICCSFNMPSEVTGNRANVVQPPPVHDMHHTVANQHCRQEPNSQRLPTLPPSYSQPVIYRPGSFPIDLSDVSSPRPLLT